MPILNIIKIYSIAVIVFLVVDLVWLGFIAKNIYQKYLGFLMKPSPNWLAAIIFYLLFVVGLVIFVILPALEKGSWQNALIFGALFGFFTYMTYELTNYAVIKDWPFSIVIIDIIWGIVLSAIVSIITFLIMRAWL